MRLTPRDHDPRSSGLAYVYAVVSRRAGGVSIGINLNPNDACNWRCVYCQVPGLVQGAAPEIDLALLRRELDGMLDEVLHGDFLERRAPPGARRLVDLAFSGNGEPTLSPQLGAAIETAGEALAAAGLAGSVELVLISNGSRVHLPAVRQALRALAARGGQLWFKLDSATAEGQARLNSSHAGVQRSEENLRAAAALCPTWIQTIALAFDGAPPSDAEQEAWLALVSRLVAERVPLRGVLLYGLARPSYQPEAPRLAPVSEAWLSAFAERIRATGLEVRVSP
jgi:wyosine [tRNA(Phe)-imidazoG37] synthetase (radical SAM superfamily)